MPLQISCIVRRRTAYSIFEDFEGRGGGGGTDHIAGIKRLKGTKQAYMFVAYINSSKQIGKIKP